jgi:hypothetical protein
MNAKAIVDHRKMPQAAAVEAIHRQHHVRGIERMNQVSLVSVLCFLCSVPISVARRHVGVVDDNVFGRNLGRLQP